jgi:HupE / UreJ protein
MLTDLGLTGWNLALALVGFNLGVEVGQLAIVLIFMPCAYALRETRFYRRAFMPAGALAIGAIATYWLAIRAAG